MELDAIIEPLRSLDWNDIDAVAAATRKPLAVLAEDGTQVRRTLLALPERPELLNLCERAGGARRFVRLPSLGGPCRGGRAVHHLTCHPRPGCPGTVSWSRTGGAAKAAGTTQISRPPPSPRLPSGLPS